MKHFFSATLLGIILVSIVYMFHKDTTRTNEWLSNADIVTIQIEYGDTLDGIGYQHKPSWMDVREYRYYVLELNNMGSSDIVAGQTLKIYTKQSYYTISGVCQDNKIITDDGHIWIYDNDYNGYADITFADNGTADAIYDDVITNITPIRR